MVIDFMCSGSMANEAAVCPRCNTRHALSAHRKSSCSTWRPHSKQHPHCRKLWSQGNLA